MLSLLLVSVALVFALDRVHSLWRDSKIIEFRYRLFEIRDYLREAATNGQVDCRDWVFLYLDSSIGKTIDFLPQISMWQVLASHYASSNDGKTKEAARLLETALAKPHNKILHDTYRLYAATIMMYLVDRHSLTLNVAFNCLKAGMHLRLVVEALQGAGKLLTEAQFSSTLLEYAYA